MSSARPPSGIGSSAFLSSLSAANRLKGPKESTSLGCELRRSFIRVVRVLMSATRVGFDIPTELFVGSKRRNLALEYFGLPIESKIHEFVPHTPLGWYGYPPGTR